MNTNAEEPNEITSEMIRSTIRWYKDELDKKKTKAEAKTELENCKAKGCLLYEDCRSCPKFGTKCPL